MYTTKKPKEEKPLVIKAPKARRHLIGTSTRRHQEGAYSRAHEKQQALRQSEI